MPTKVNIVLDDDAKAEMERLVARGRRSRVINDALRTELTRIRRERVPATLDRLRQQTAPVAAEEIVRLLARDRRRA
jgi:Arc/MetJ-type ribon-helix-helix transcriptional regulator